MAALVGDNRYVSEVKVDSNYLKTLFKEWYEIEADEDYLYAVFDQGLSVNGFERIESEFARTRFVLTRSQVAEVARDAFGVGDLWENYVKFDDEWINECVRNIADSTPNLFAADFGSKLSSEIPASDRYVSPKDNQNEFDEIKSELASLEEVVRGNNSASEVDKLIALSEIAIFEESICQPRLAVDLIERFLGFCRERIVQIVSLTVASAIISRLEGLIDLFIGAIAV